MPDPSPAQNLRTAAAAAMRQHGFQPEFSAAVLREVRSLDDPSDDPLPKNVRDLRAELWSSVDNRESRDLDQIEVAERLPDDSIRVRIGVADVDALVRLGSAADAHAAANTTSVYTGVAVFPMLPERLCTDLSSLNEGVDRLVAGALNFESVEATPVVVHGKVVDLAVAWRNRARDMIEGFMVAANRSVAAYLLERGSPSTSRVKIRYCRQP
jgi:exoribonuclease-2